MLQEPWYYIIMISCLFLILRNNALSRQEKQIKLPVTWTKRRNQNKQISHRPNTLIFTWLLDKLLIGRYYSRGYMLHYLCFVNKHVFWHCGLLTNTFLTMSTFFSTLWNFLETSVLPLLWTVRSKVAVTVITTTPNKYW